jgi:alkylation response protein AidB-like acyl-CoA dehydrogenase
LIERGRQFAALAFETASRADEAATIDADLWLAFRRSGLAMSAFPEPLGGCGLCDDARQLELCTLLRLMGAGDLSIARLFEGHVNAVALVERYGTPSQLQALAADVASGALSAVWGADDESGLRIAGDQLPAVLVGRKILASGAGLVTRPVVTARGMDGQFMVLLKLAPEHPVDLRGWQPNGMRSTATGSVAFSGIEITDQEIVGGADDFTRQPTFSGGAWRFCAVQLGAVERLVDLFRAELVARGRHEDSFQLQRVAHGAAAARTARFWVEAAARRLGDADDDAEAVVAFANLTRMVTERCALDVMELVQRGTGLASFIRPHPIERISRDLSTYLRQPAPDRSMSEAARTLLRSPLPIGEL